MRVLLRGKILSFLSLAVVCSLSSADISTLMSRLIQGSVDDETVAELRAIIRLDPSAPAWWAWLGYAHSLRQEWSEAKTAYDQAKQLKAAPNIAWFPPALPVSWLPQHGSTQTLTIGDLTVWQSPAVFCEPKPAIDPKHGERFAKVIFVYGASKGANLANQVVHWMVQTSEIPQQLSDAPMVLAAALLLFSERFGIPLKFPLKGWLFSKGNGSAFSFSGHTLFYGTLPKDRWSWWLKVAHEAGHHTVPAFGEFDGLHEPYSGGFLGERLFAVWLWDAGRGTRDGEVEGKLSEYLRKVVCAEIVRAQQWLLQGAQTEKPPMQVFLGLCLYIERLGGIGLLSDIMSKAPNDSWDGFKIGFEKCFAERLRNGLTICLKTPDANTALSAFNLNALREGLSAPSIQLAWWLPEGKVQCEVKVQGNGTLQLRWGNEQIAEWVVNASEAKSFSCNFVNPHSGWQRLRFWWQKGSGKILSVTFSRKGD